MQVNNISVRGGEKGGRIRGKKKEEGDKNKSL